MDMLDSLLRKPSSLGPHTERLFHNALSKCMFA